MSEKLKIALIGCGVIGQKRLKAIQETGLGEIAAVSDISPERATATAQAFKTISADPMSILKDPNISAVIVATTNRSLAEYGKLALENGKHALLEKPGAISLQQVKEMLSAQKTAKTKSLCKIGYNHRFHPAAKKIAALLSNDTSPQWIRAAYGHGGRPGYEKEWRFQKELSGGGEIIDQGVHLLDLIRWWTKTDFQLASSVRQNAFYRSTEEDNGFITLQSESGTIAQLHCSTTQWKNIFRVEISTSKSLYIWEGLGNPNYGAEKLTHYQRNPKGGAPTEEIIRFEPMTDTSWKEEWEHFYGCMLGTQKEMFSPLSESQWILSILSQCQELEVIQTAPCS